MTSCLCRVASGRVVLALEGGYNLRSISACGVSCVDALLKSCNVHARPEDWDEDWAAADSAPTGDVSAAEVAAVRTTVTLLAPFWSCLTTVRERLDRLENALVSNATLSTFVSHRVVLGLICAFCCAQGQQSDVPDTPLPTLTCKSAVFLDPLSGRVVASIAPDATLPVASLTKLMTALVTAQV